MNSQQVTQESPQQQQSPLESQLLNNVVQGSRAQVIYDSPVDDSEDVELEEVSGGEDELDSDELDVDLTDLPDDPEEEPEDDFVEGSPRFEQFKEDFNKAFGLPLEEARDLVQSLKEDSVKRQLNEQKYELSAAWDVPVTVVDQRLAVVAKMWEKLPADKKAAYDSTKGAQLLWNQYETKRASTGAAKVSKTMKSTAKQTSTPKWLYTQRQIDQMDAATYSAEADKIMLAYAQGKVKR